MTILAPPAALLELDRLLRRELAGRRFIAEKELALAVAGVLTAAEVPFEAEHRLTPRERADFFLAFDGIAIELKVDGATASVARQLLRYARLDAVRALLLVTTCVQHTQLPAEIAGKPVNVAHLRSFP